MNSRRSIAVACGTCFLFASIPTFVLGQTTPTTTTTAPTTTTTNTNANSTRSTSNTVNTTSTGQTTQLKASSIGAGSTTSIPSNSNNLAPWYGDPYSMGMASKYVNGPPTANSNAAPPPVTFNKANYVSTTNTAAATTPSTTTTTQNGFTTVGVPRTPQYATVLSDDIPLVEHKAVDLRANVLDLIARSTKLKSKNNIQVAVNDGAVILTGQVGTDRERHLVEAMIGMTPGVRGVQNDLTVTAIK